MKVVLFAINGSFSHTNLAIRCLREPLERAGFDVVLVEHTLRDRTAHILEHLYRQRADIYGFSCYIWNIEPMLTLAETLKSLLPKSKIVLGGPEVSYGLERFADASWIDAIVRGEGEEAMLSLCQAIKEEREYPRVSGTDAVTFADTGVHYREGEETGGILYYESSRGCPYSCAYCLSSATHGVRFKSVEQTLEELLTFEKIQANCKVIKFVDRTFNADVKRANAIWQALLDEKYTKSYHFEICASLLNEESFDILSRFPKGKVQLEIGLQSTNPETLAASSRHIDAHKVIDAARRIREEGNVHVHLDLIAGLPYEDYASFAKSFDDAYGSSDMLQLGFLKLLHGTELRERAEEYEYRYLPTPPYTVLQSKWITYPQMQRLTHIAEVLDRYLESGRFAHALWYLTPLMPSPFRFWEGLSLYLEENDNRPLQRISQPDAFRYLLAYAGESLADLNVAKLKEMLAADFSQHENKNPPSFLR